MCLLVLASKMDQGQGVQFTQSEKAGPSFKTGNSSSRHHFWELFYY